MPEGPEVESVRRTLSPHVVGAHLSTPWVSKLKLRTPTTRAQLRFVDGRKVQSVGRKGKLLWLLLDAEHEQDDDDQQNFSGLFIRLGMSGRLLLTTKDAPKEKHTHVVIDVISPDAKTKTMQLRYVDPRRFGEVVPFRDQETWQKSLDRLGPCPNVFDDDTRAIVAQKIRRTKRAIKEAILDQSVVCGVGNIYASEACFLAKLSPLLTGDTLTQKQAMRLVHGIESCMNEAVENGGTSFSDYVDANGQQGQHQHHLWVFQRTGEPCKRCVETSPKRGALVEKTTQGGRATFYCGTCQQ